MTEIIILIPFIVFVIFGVHAVTRQDKLLSFLGVYIKEEIESQFLSKKVESDLLTLQEHFFEDLNEDMSNVKKFALVLNYEQARANIENYHDRYFELNEIVKKKKQKTLWRVISPFAPMLTECLTCMSSFWSSVILLIYFLDVNVLDVSILFFFVPFAVAGFVEIIFTFARKDFSGIIQAIENIND